MCGIAGTVSRRIGHRANLLHPMLESIAHRGPDDRGTWISDDDRVAFGHLRLSIIDLSPAGHQPMIDVASGNVIVFNGEIYNFERIREELLLEGVDFRTGSDTEVLLAAYRRWGTTCLQKLNGMFAFALHDKERKRVILARDRIGKKPLYFHHANGTLVFASEAKGILAAFPDTDWPLDPESVQAYFAFGYIPGNRSIFSGIHRLPPGHFMTYDIQRDIVTVEPYWTISAVLESRRPESDREHLLSDLEMLLDDSVRLRLIADVPLGVLLSGGIDSSLTTALAARHTGRVRTFTVTFPGGGAYDEREHARIVADHFRTEHHELPLPEPDFEIFREIATQLDEPLGDPSVIPTYLISRLTRRHVTVALGGDGGDELFGGYSWYRAGLAGERMFARVPKVLRRAAAGLTRWVPPGVPGRNFIRARAGDLCDFLVTSSTSFDPELRRSLLEPMMSRAGAHSLTFPESLKRSLWPPVGDSVTRMSVLDLRSFLPDDILIKVDRASMAFALEMRAPFLDYRVIEFALQRVPSNLKATADGSRDLQRELARKLLPEKLQLNRKQGFVMPVHDWFAREWGDELAELLRSGEITEWIQPAVVMDLLAGHRRGRTNGIRLFTVAMFALWLNGLRESKKRALPDAVARPLTSRHAG